MNTGCLSSSWLVSRGSCIQACYCNHTPKCSRHSPHCECAIAATNSYDRFSCSKRARLLYRVLPCCALRAFRFSLCGAVIVLSSPIFVIFRLVLPETPITSAASSLSQVDCTMYVHSGSCFRRSCFLSFRFSNLVHLFDCLFWIWISPTVYCSSPLSILSDIVTYFHRITFFDDNYLLWSKKQQRIYEDLNPLTLPYSTC